MKIKLAVSATVASLFLCHQSSAMEPCSAYAKYARTYVMALDSGAEKQDIDAATMKAEIRKATKKREEEEKARLLAIGNFAYIMREEGAQKVHDIVLNSCLGGWK